MPNNEPERIKALLIGFLKELQNKGFSIGVDTYVEALTLTDRYLQENPVAPPDGLSKYLSPLICRNSQEQKDFQYLFDHLLIDQYNQWLNSCGEQVLTKFREATEEKRKVTERKYAVASVLSILLLVVFYVLFFRFDIFSLFAPQLVPAKNSTHYMEAGDSYVKSLNSILKNPKDTQKLQIEQYFEGQEFRTTGFNHGFDLNTPGEQRLITHVFKKKYDIDKTVTDTLRISPKVEISINRQQSIAYVNTPATYELVKKDTLTLPYAWYVITQKDTVLKLRKNPNFTHAFPDTGYYEILVRYQTDSDSFLSKFPNDHFTTSLGQQVLKDEVTISSNAVPLPENIDYKVNPLWIVPLLATVIGCILYLLWLYKKTRKIRAVPFHIVNAPLDPLEGKDAPFDIPYKPDDDNISENKLLKKLSGHFIKSIETRIRKLDFKRTISGTVKNLGLITPAYTYKKQLVYYLILLDEEYSNSQQFRLFNYLVNLFVKKAVNFDVYHYSQFPDLLYKPGELEGISLYQITNAYVDSTLLVFSSGHSLIDYKTPSIISPFNTILQYWYKRILITPVPFNDWGQKETVLNASFDLVPADIVGLLEVVRLIQEQSDIPDVMSRNNLATYSSKFVDFQNIETLKKYLDYDDDLLQWLCALAVYHEIQWEMTLEIGKNVLDANRHKINYENLLKFSRIKWMYEGQFSEYVRLMLLKNLRVDNELKARATVLKILDDIHIDPSSFSYEEKMVATYTNSFFLFATRPENKEIYQSIYGDEIQIQQNAEKFITLYQGRRFSDIATDTYILKGGKNNGAFEEWETPISYEGRNVSIKEYLESKQKQERLEHNTEQQQRVNKIIRKMIMPASLAVLLLISLIGLFSFKGSVFNKNINSTLGLVDTVKIGLDSSFVTIMPPCDALVDLAGDRQIAYTIFRNGTVLTSDSLSAKDTSIIGFPSGSDTVSVTFNINNALYSTNVSSNSNTNYYFSLQSPVCVGVPTDTIYFHVPSNRKGALSHLMDSLRYAGEFALITEDQPASSGNFIDVFEGRNIQKARDLSGAVNSLLNVPLTIRQLDGPVSNTIHVRIGKIDSVPPKDTIFIQICSENDRPKAQGFASLLNAGSQYYAPGIELQANRCYNEVRYFNNQDVTKANDLANQASRHFDVDIKAIRSALKSSGYNKLEVWINLPPRPKILWVDDYPDPNNTADIDFFQKNNIHVDLAKTNYDGFLKMNSNVYACVITDIGRTNPERCVLDKDKAGVEFVGQVNFPKNFVFVCAPATTIETNRIQLLKAGIPAQNLTGDKNLLRRAILSNVKKGNTRPFTQSMDCVGECDPDAKGDYYTLFYLRTGDELNPASRNMLDDLLNRILKDDKYSIRLNFYAYNGASKDENLSVSKKHADAIKTYFAERKFNRPGTAFNAWGADNPYMESPCDRIEITLTEIKEIVKTEVLIVDTVRNTLVGYRSSVGNKWENVPVKNLGIILTLAENPKKEAATFEFEVENSDCPVKFTGSKKVFVGKPTPIFSSCGLTLVIKLTSVRSNVAYFEAYIGRKNNAQNIQQNQTK